VSAAQSEAILLRDAVAGDANALAALGRASFMAAFGHLYRPEDLARFLEQTYSVEAVREEISDPAIIHQLAVRGADGALAAYCKLRYPSPYRQHSDAANPISLAQLYTDPAMTGRGLGAMLMGWVLEEARRRGCDAVQLSVWSENHGAQRFYARHGYSRIADIDFWVGDHRDDEFLYELRL